MLRRLAVTIALLTLATPLLAQSLRVGPEHSIAQSPIREALLGQSVPAVATNGDDFFVAWTDYRSGSYIADVFGTRVSLDGEVLDPTGLPVATTYAGEFATAVAWERESYLVAYDMYRPNIPGDFVLGSRVSRDGTVLARGVSLNASGASIYSPPAIGSNGMRALLGTTFGDGTARVSIVSDAESVNWSILQHRIFSIVPWNGSFVAVGREDRTGDVKASLISGRGELLQTRTIMGAPAGSAWYAAAASSGDEVLIAVSGDQTISLFLMRDEQNIESLSGIDASRAPVTVAWDGTKFVVSWVAAGEGSEVRVKRVSREGNIVDATPLVLGRTSKRIASISSAAARGRTLIAWDESGDGYGSAYRAFGVFGAVVADSAFAPPGAAERIVVSLSPSPQMNASIAPRPGGYLVAWQEFIDTATSVWERTQHGPIFATYVDEAARALGDPLRVADDTVDQAAIATLASSRGDVVLWKSGYASLNGVVVRSGEVRALDLPDLKALSRPAVVEDASGYAIAYAAYSDLPFWQGTVLARLTPDFALVGAPVGIGKGSQPPAMAVDGDALLIVTGIEYPNCQVLCPSFPPPEIRLSRVTLAGTLIRDAVIAEEYAETSMACGPVCLIAWGAQDGLAYRIASKDLTTISTRALVPNAMPEEPPRVAWDGDRFVITWSQGNGEVSEVRVATLTASGEPSEPFVVATSRDDMFEWMYSPFPRPLVASGGAGSTLLVYGRYDESATGGGLPRLFARTLDRVGRVRAIRK